MECEFEEKQFEQHLNFELLSKKNLLYVPGQVLENTLGFDAALYTSNSSFWKYFSSGHVKSGVHRPGIKLDNKWWKSLDLKLDYFPKFKCNVFIQHKRPTHLTTANSKEWPHWKREYYRYGLTPHQQKSLEKLEDKIKDDSVVVYASPAFAKLTNLWDAINKGSLVNETNFVQPSKLKGHDAFTYILPGNTGRAYSEPEDIVSFNFIGRIARLSGVSNPNDTNRTFLIRTGDIIDGVMDGREPLQDLYRDIVSYLSDSIEPEIALAIIRVDTFCFLKKTTWKIAI
jgi:hypothetical protein